MGGLLTLYLGERHEMAGLIPMAAAVKQSNRLLPLVPIVKHFIQGFPKEPPEKSDFVNPEIYDQLWSYDVYPTAAAHELLKLMREVRPRLSEITAPILIIQGEQDNMVAPATALSIYDQVGSEDKELLMVENSGHILTLDAGHEIVWQRAYEFIQDHAPAELC